MTGPVMLDVEGLTLQPHEAKRLSDPLVGGLILFARNCQTRVQIKALVQQIRACRQQPLLIAIDHEGGRVQRMRTDGFTHLPAMATLGQLWMKDALLATRTASAVGYVLAAELRSVDVDLSFTPVLDLDYGTSGVIGDRAFHSDERVVTMLAKSLMHGLLQAGMQACGKHFPGHGYIKADSHHEVPIDKRSLKQIMQHDAAPYGWLSPMLGSVMPAHVIYPKVDHLPAGFSPKWLKILRDQVGFTGAIFSDDLSMQGATVVGDIVARANAARDAGCDMVLVCNAPDQADALLSQLNWPNHRASSQRIAGLIATSPAPQWKDLLAGEQYQQAQKLIAALS